MQTLELDLTYNNLGENIDSVNFLVESMKYLPNNLQNLKLYLNENNIEKIFEF